MESREDSMQFQPFEMERWMSWYEQDVDYNLSESGAHPAPLRELLGDRPDVVDGLMDVELGYPHVNGTPELRERIAALYDGAGPDNVLVTVGTAEANYLTIHTLLNPGDEIVVMLPNYMQVWGVAKNLGCKVKEFHLREEDGWAPDLDELDSVVTDQTKLIAACNPNNPTGRILTENEMDEIVARADRVGAWLLADEVYRGAERTREEETPSFYGRYPKVIANAGLSKAYGLPGLRIGWTVCPPDVVDQMWARHEYITISAAKLSDQLAAIALSPEVRARLLRRIRTYVRDGFAILERWLGSHGGLFSLRPPDASAIAFIRYHLDINSSELADRLRVEKSVLVVPGDHFGMDHFLRISFGFPEEYLVGALDRIHEMVAELQPAA
jgi:aspartate/methionine/tyrosine aminotransferase